MYAGTEANKKRLDTFWMPRYEECVHIKAS